MRNSAGKTSGSSTRMVLSRPVVPLTRRTREVGTLNCFEKNFNRYRFAFPSTGGAVIATFNRSPST